MTLSLPGMVDSSADSRPTFYEFFAGGGMVRAGLGDGWRCLFANDIDSGKAASYRANWGEGDFRLGDINTIETGDLPGVPNLVWGSFPCQDLSLAGPGGGLERRRSGTFFAFWNIILGLVADGRAPSVVAIENVCGALTSRGGRDFEAMCRTFLDAGYRPGALVVNADRFLPQSRPRLFIIGIRNPASLSMSLLQQHPTDPFHPPALVQAASRLPPALREALLWWRLPGPRAVPLPLADVLEPDGPNLRWHASAQTERLISQMSPLNRAKLNAVQAAGQRAVGAVFRRTRIENGRKVQRAEVRFDRAGCLRTPAGGSSRQILLIVDGAIRSRLMSGREMARLMGLEESYVLPAAPTAAARLCGDGVAVPVVRHLVDALIAPLVGREQVRRRAA